MPYFFVADGESFCDSYARMITGREYFGRRQGKVRACFDFQDFDWTGENWKKIPARDMILYQCHVRGFTKHKSSNVKNPGTFSGMEEKLSYLKDLGVNTLLLMPAYDFNECMHDENGVDFKRKLITGAIQRMRFILLRRLVMQQKRVNRQRSFRS